MQQSVAYWQLPDAPIMDAYYTQHPYENRTQWYKVLSAHRAAVMHIGYFDFEANPEILDELIAFRAHLQDLLLRLIFRILGYTKEYRSPIHHVSHSPLVEWLRAQPTLYRLDAPDTEPVKSTEPLSSA